MDNEMDLIKNEISTDQARAMQSVQAAMIIAQKFNRKPLQSETRIIDACKRFGLAKSATYLYPRGKTSVTGPSIRLAEVLAQNWGNLDFGIRVLESNDNESYVESYCWDLETNVRQTKIFNVRHERKARGVIEKLYDPRDIYELIANNGARRLRACILGIIPGDIVEKALLQCKATVNAGESAVPIKERISTMVKVFNGYGVDLQMLENKLGHKMELTTTDELLDLHGIYTSLKDGQSKRSDWFEFEGSSDTEEKKKVDELGKKLLSKAESPK